MHHMRNRRCGSLRHGSVSLEVDNTELAPGLQLTVLGVLLEFRSPASITSIRFLLGYDSLGKKRDHGYEKPSPVLCKAVGWTVWHAVAKRRTLVYAADLLWETLGYLKETYGHLSRDFLERRTQPLDPEDLSGKAVLHIAAERANIEVIMALLLMGADKDARSSEGAKPIDYAQALLMEDIKLSPELDQEEAVAEKEMERRRQSL
ncbi:hypothetical protein B0H67DRAFT_568512 [Lasiosphaeris hirsuta]|uniref:Uncharacterized protein n=1 Tax=Lasiosphaeris hirsuta TaxID=260670 RepID=A0AA40E5I0_9PEZI|nr:hypothetical protein B0H67DRAFT_568512 [Lasiosphaeris hirsuta]